MFELGTRLPIKAYLKAARIPLPSCRDSGTLKWPGTARWPLPKEPKEEGRAWSVGESALSLHLA